MSDLKIRIADATKAAMKARDKSRLGVLRLINADIKRLEVDERRELADSDVLVVLNRMLKQRTDSERQYRDAGRTDLAEQEAFEIGVIEEFMPAPLDDAELDALIRNAVAETGAESMRDMGKVMNALRDKAQGRADMGEISSRVKAVLAPR